MIPEYTKVIKSGDIVEIFEYEKAPAIRPRIKRSRPEPVEEAPTDERDSIAKQRRLDNLKRTRQRFIRTVRSNLSRSSPPAFLTLTFRGIVSIQDASPCLTRFTRRLSKYVQSDYRYIAVPEFQKRGSVHYHVLIWGLPEKLITTERQTRFIADLWGEGFIDIIKTDGSPKLAGYLAKYMVKSMNDDRLFSKKAYITSHSVKRPEYFKSSAILDYSKLLWGVDKTLVFYREFSTEWCGTARYKCYELNSL